MKFRAWPVAALLGLAHMAKGADEPSFFASVDNLVQQDTEWQEAQSTLEANYADIAFDRAQGLPETSIKAQESWRKIEGVDAGQSANLELVSSINVFAFGRDRLHWKLADVKDDNRKLKVESLYLAAEKRAALLLIEYRASERNLELARKIHAHRKRVSEVARARFEKGLLSDLDYKKTLIDLELAHIRLLERETDFSTRSKVLRARLQTEVPQVTLPLEGADMNWDALMRGLSRESKGKNLNERIANATVQEKTLLRDLGARNHLPSIDLSLSHQVPLSEQKPENIRETSVAVTLSIPLLDRGLKKTERVRTWNEWSAAEAKLRDTERVSLEEEENLVRTLTLLEAALASRKKLLETTRSMYETNLKRFSLAAISINDLSIEEERLFLSEGEYVDSQIQINRKLVDYCHLRGYRLRECLKS